MQPFFEQDNLSLYCGDLREVLPTLPEASVDFVVTDPPYGIGFMEKDWDHEVPGPEYWRAIARVCKPGALLLAFGGTRTYHHLTCAIEEAGWEIRDCLMWLYGQGMPKCGDIGKLIDKSKGAERRVIGDKLDRPGYHLHEGKGNGCYGGGNGLHAPGTDARLRAAQITAPATPEAAKWTGFAMALKPAWEPIVLAMKPLEGTIAHNALTWGVAGINIDATRIGTESTVPARGDSLTAAVWASTNRSPVGGSECGRWPANLLLDEEAAAALDAQTGTLTSGTNCVRTKSGDGYHGRIGKAGDVQVSYGDSGGASRFFKVIPCHDQSLNFDSANGAEVGFSPQGAVEDSVLALAANADRHEGTASNEPLARFIAAMQNALGNASGCDTQLILSSAEKCVRESKHMLTELLKRNPVNCAEIQRLTNIITTTQDLLSTDGFVDLAMSSDMLRSWAVGGLGCRPRFKYVGKAKRAERGSGNDHPTVKPLALMEYLLTLLSTPDGGVVLDPFAGSGTTLLAAKRLGRPCIGVELTQHNCEIARGRLHVA